MPEVETGKDICSTTRCDNCGKELFNYWFHLPRVKNKPKKLIGIDAVCFNCFSTEKKIHSRKEIVFRSTYRTEMLKEILERAKQIHEIEGKALTDVNFPILEEYSYKNYYLTLQA